MGDIAEVFEEALILSELTGRYVAERLLNQKRAKHFTEDSELGNWKLEIFQDIDIPSAFDEAVEFFLSKGIITKPEFSKLSAEMRRRSFTIAADSREYVLERTKDMLATFLQEGGTIEEFSDDIFGFFQQAGVTPRNPYYYDLIFINNIQESINRGKDIIFEQAEEDEFPLMQFHTVGDDRVRLEHARIDGFTAPKNDPIWQRLKPPLDHGCRCSRSLVHRDEGLSPTPPDKYPVLTGRGFGFVK